MSELESKAVFSNVIEAVNDRLSRNKRVRRNLPGGGRLRLDRQLPFLCVYRSPVDRGDAGTSSLVTTEAAYLVANDPVAQHGDLSKLCRAIGEIIQEHFGAFLLLEVWSDETRDPNSSEPGFRIFLSESDATLESIEEFQEGLRHVELHGPRTSVELMPVKSVVPPGLSELKVETSRGWEGFHHFGISVKPIYRDTATGEIYPLILHSLRRQFAVAIRKSVIALTTQDSPKPTLHYHSLGPSTLVKTTRLVDQQLVEVSESFDFLLQVTPINADDAWREFSKSGFKQVPQLRYRPLPYHPSLLKRRLYNIPLEDIEDATLAHIFWEKQTELDRHISGLRNIGTQQFLYESLRIYGRPDKDIVALAREILENVSAETVSTPGKYVGTKDIVAKAHEHFDYYHQRLPDFNARVEVSGRIASGIMVSQDCLYVSETARFRQSRLAPLLHHEIGTHLLTYFNGRQQRLRQLYAGLAGYEALQEGLAVLAEYLAGGLTALRLRKLAARVVAVQLMVEGTSFVETFRCLHQEHRLTAASAFTTTLRVFRGGGLTKDAIYLRGLRDLLKYLGRGHDVEPLYVGKISLGHVSMIQQLRRSGIVRAPAILPRLWDQSGIQERLDACRGRSVMELLENNR